MKVTAFIGEDSVNRRLAMEAAIKATGETPISFDISQPSELQRALEALGGFFQAPPLMVWRKAEALKKLQPQRLNELTLDRFVGADHQQLFMEIEDTGTRGNAKPAMTAFKHCLPPGQEVKVEVFPLPAPWLTDLHIKWILTLAEQHGLRLGAQLARQLRLMVGFDPERLFSEIKMLAEMKQAEPNLVLSSSALDQWITADNVDFELLVDAVLQRRWDEVCRLCRQLETLGMPWAEIVSKLQTASWSALQFVSAKGRKPEEMAPLLRTSDKRVFAMTTKFASVSSDRAVALHSVAMGLSKTSFNETALLGRTNLRLLSALSECWT